IVRLKDRTITPADLPAELRRTPAVPSVTVVGHTPPGPSAVDVMFDRMVTDGESFWSAVYEPFMTRDLTRDDLPALITRGLERTCGSYKALAGLFNIPITDYKRFVSLLHRHQCHVPFHPFRKRGAKVLSLQPRAVTDYHYTEPRLGTGF